MPDRCFAMVQPSPGSTVAFLAIVAAVAIAISWAAHRARVGRAAVIGIACIMAGSAALASSGGLLSVHGSPLMMLYPATCLGVAVFAACSRFGERLAVATSWSALVLFQSFRLPLELVLHEWWSQGVIPVQLTYAGHNFDIVTGSLALVVGLLLALGVGGRTLVRAFHVVGLGFLLVIIGIVVLSSPVPIRAYDNDPVLELAFYFPTTWILPMCVGAALFGHLVGLRATRKWPRDDERHAAGSR